ncbi:MAG: Choline-sulfatase (EC [uncultured Sulfurovum sp.]|uniref:Choline-sulfatase (EC) n=1 Tax=uncultured Sulfurovum sp. TaxID=269237 RepID=A0A6S6TKF5_9BACT|nr:MAG: Choline-sulfatase (EC [uncultured Sulfurovum sp.]
MMDFSVEGSTLLTKILFFNLFILEYVFISFVVYGLFKFRFLVYVLLITYIAIHISQLVTYQISSEFLSMLALDNVEFIGFLFTLENVWIIVRTLLLLLVVSYIFAKVVDVKDFISSRLWFIGLLFLGFSSFVLAYAPKSMVEQRDVLLKHNYFEHTSPTKAFINIFIEEKQLKLQFTKEEVNRLNELGYHFNPLNQYNIMKDDIYTGKFKSSVEKPNVIVIFTEGFSARTSSVYSEKYELLTPNLKRFSQDASTLRVDNFYNHTAATYRGLHGQLCSLFPYMGGGNFWFDNETLNLHKNNYKCLPHVLKNNGYETVYLNMHYKDESANDDMVSYFGFDTIHSGEYLSNRYLGGVKKIKNAYMSDHQAYESLTKYLQEREEGEQTPFLLTTYTIETHAFLDIGEDGVPYKEGKNNVLNTIYNMDHAFGKFWDYFKASKFAKNTIILFTSDHAHYNGKEYINVMKEYKEEQYYGIFVDRVPLLVYAPHLELPQTFNAKHATSIDITPTLLHLVNAKEEKNAFIGHSLFEKNRQDFGISKFGSTYYMLKEHNLIYKSKNVLPEYKDDFRLIHRFITYTHELEKQNRLYKH